MPDITNSKLVEKIINILVKKIRRRTSESYAVVSLDIILKKLIPKYDFLKYIDIQKTIYSEGIESVTVYSDLDSIDKDLIFSSLKEIITQTIRYLERNADYFFIKEFQEALEDEDQNILEKIGIDLSLLQLKYSVNSKEIQKRNNKKITEEIIFTLSSVLNKVLAEKNVIDILSQSIEKLKEKHDFLMLINFSNSPDSEGFYRVNINQDIDKVWEKDLAEALQDLIQIVITNVEWKGKESFIETLKKQLGSQKLEEIIESGINFDVIQQRINKKKHEIIVKKTIESLIKLIGQKTSLAFATLALKEVIQKLDDTHDILKKVEIETTQDIDLNQKIKISSEINEVDSYIIGKAMRDIIKETGRFLGKKTYNYIEDFKGELGEEYLREIEKIGVNLHFLELKFS